MAEFVINNTGNRSKDIATAKKTIARRNKGMDFKRDQRVLKSLKLSPAGKTLGGLPIPKGTHFLVTTKRKKNKK